MSWFKRVVLVASPEDGYVPFMSARLEMDTNAPFDKNPKMGNYSERLLNNY